MLLGINPEIALRHSSWDGFFLSQQSISLQYTYYQAIRGSSFHEIEFRGDYEQPIIPGFRMNIRGGGIWKSTSDTLFEERPRKAQVQILPRYYSALHYAGLSAGLEKYLYKSQRGTLSAQCSYQGVFSNRQDTDWEFDHGPSVGVLFYLSRIALPAIGIGTAYNVVSGLYQFTFTIGMSF